VTSSETSPDPYEAFILYVILFASFLHDLLFFYVFIDCTFVAYFFFCGFVSVTEIGSYLSLFVRLLYLFFFFFSDLV